MQSMPVMCSASKVALLAEGVDRNTQTAKRVKNINVVALLAEGVDRNNHKI